MKKLSWLLSGMIVAAFMLVTSCSKDDSTDTSDQKPSLTLQVGSSYTSANTTVTVKTPLLIGIRAMSNSSSSSKLSELILTRTFNGTTSTYDTVFSSTTYNVDFTLLANSQVGTENFVFTIKDKAGQTNTLTLVITTTAIAGNINTYTMKILGAQNNTTGSSFASSNGTVYVLSDAKANSTLIDWLYYYGASDLATIAAPNDAHAAEIYNSTTSGLQTWTKLNATKFKLITDNVDFDAIGDDSVIVSQTASGVTATRVPTLSASKLIAFVTEGGKKGIMKVESIDGTNAGTMTISVKVQE
ncbi:MAG: hypothetical protein Q8867_09685 [Bacteroidota bacterium]|nr:hypothetical protein [Bacteroidota bacterium]